MGLSRGGGPKKRICQKGVSSKTEGRDSLSLPCGYFEDTQGPGPRCSWLSVSLVVAGTCSASPLRASRPSGGLEADSCVEGGPGSGGGGDGKVSYVNCFAL